MTERDDRLPAGKRRRQPDGPDQRTGAFGAIIQARDPEHAIIGRGYDWTSLRTGSLSQ